MLQLLALEFQKFRILEIVDFHLIIIKYVCIPFFCCSKSVKKSESDVFGSSRLLTAGELRRQREVKRRQERKRGYCECCHVKYEDLDKVNFCLKTFRVHTGLKST